jgi:signal transduction histidine kinase
MSGFYRRALSKLEKLTAAQSRELIISASEEISRMETVLDSLPSGILVCDEKHCLVMANKAALRLLPLTFQDSGKTPLWQAVRDERIVELFEETLIQGDKVQDCEIDVTIKNRSYLLSISILPLVQRSRITGSLVFIQDITDKRSREARLRQVENLASLTTVAAGVAHEIKNPLGSISIHLQLMQKALIKNFPDNNTPDSRILKYLDILNEEVDRLNKIVVDFLFAVRPMTLKLRQGDINSLVADVIEFIRYELELSHIVCISEYNENIPPVFMDERYMKQALLNLIKNAMAAMEGGGTLTVSTDLADDEIQISVCDTGVGIFKDNLSRIFEPYYTTKETGTGLGLTIVYKIIREHRGEISVQSRENEGSCFTISLPLEQKDQKLIVWEVKK